MRRKAKNTLLSGYLLLEVTLALGITAIILGTVFAIAQWNLSVSNVAIQSSNEQMKQSAFFSFFDRAFTESTGSMVLRLTNEETAKHYLSELTIQNNGDRFSWPGQNYTPRVVKIRTVSKRNGLLDIVLEYYRDPLLIDEETRVIDPEDDRQEPVESLILLRDIWRFEWKVWDGTSLGREDEIEWQFDWDTQQLPQYLELNVKFDAQEDPVIHKFWIPRKQNPQQTTRAFLIQ